MNYLSSSPSSPVFPLHTTHDMDGSGMDRILQADIKTLRAFQSFYVQCTGCIGWSHVVRSY